MVDNAAQGQVVTVEQLTEQVAPGGRITPIQQIGFRLLTWVGLIIFVVTLLVGVVFLRGLPSLPTFPASATTAEEITRYRELLQAYRETRAIAVEDATKAFQLVIASAFLPVFTTVLGYVFGRRD